MRKRTLSTLLALALVLGLFPATARAASWADDAVNTLNDVYNTSVFSSTEDDLDAASLTDILTEMGCVTDINYGSGPITRSVACDVLADIFNLPVGSNSAIQYLYNQNIINGYQGGDLGESNAITDAQFSVITYRVLNSVGGGAGSSIAGLAPGTEEYISWMYLSAQGCLDDTDTPDANMDSDTLNRWKTALDDKASSVGDISVDGLSKADAAVVIVIKKLQANQVFSDVPPDNPYYDGVTYLYDRNILQGRQDGSFAPNNPVDRVTLAVLLRRTDLGRIDYGTEDLNSDDSINWLDEQILAKEYAVDCDYMTPAESEDWWTETTTREDAIVAIVKQQRVDVSTVNTAILDRFNDVGSISEAAEPYLAYAVSIGLVRGTADGNFAPDADLTRGAAGMILYRTLLGADTTKMQDYTENVGNALGITQ